MFFNIFTYLQPKSNYFSCFCHFYIFLIFKTYKFWERGSFLAFFQNPQKHPKSVFQKSASYSHFPQQMQLDRKMGKMSVFSILTKSFAPKKVLKNALFSHFCENFEHVHFHFDLGLLIFDHYFTNLCIGTRPPVHMPLPLYQPIFDHFLMCIFINNPVS